MSRSTPIIGGVVSVEDHTLFLFSGRADSRRRYLRTSALPYAKPKPPSYAVEVYLAYLTGLIHSRDQRHDGANGQASNHKTSQSMTSNTIGSSLT